MKRLKLLLILGIIIFMQGRASAQKVGTTGGRVFIDCSDMPSGAVKTPSEVASSKTTGGRMVRHIHLDPVNSKVSPKFEISNTDLSTNLFWFEAAGWSLEAHYSLTDGTAANTGCAAYDPLSDIATNGNWRLPTQRELMLICVLLERRPLPDFTSFNTLYNYWSATEAQFNGIWCVHLFTGETYGTTKNSGPQKVRCVRDM